MHVFVSEQLRVMRDNVQSKWWISLLITIRDKEVNGTIRKRALIVETLESVQPGSRESRQDGSRPGTEQSGPQDLPVRERTRLRDDHPATWLLPTPG
jgi:hypothetical protein